MSISSDISILADMVWPALLLEPRLLGIYSIVAGLIVEGLVLRFGGFGLSWKKALIVDVVMNTVSTLAGIALVPVLGIIWEFFPGSIIYRIFEIGTFNLFTWAGTFAIAVFATTFIEAAVVKWGFEIPLGKKRFWVLCAANCVSVGIAFASLWIYPPKFQ